MKNDKVFAIYLIYSRKYNRIYNSIKSTDDWQEEKEEAEKKYYSFIVNWQNTRKILGKYHTRLANTK